MLCPESLFAGFLTKTLGLLHPASILWSDCIAQPGVLVAGFLTKSLGLLHPASIVFSGLSALPGVFVCGFSEENPGAAPPRVKDGRCALICMKGFDEGVLFCIALIDLAATYSPAP